MAARWNVIDTVEKRLCLAWDFTGPDTLAASHLNNAINGPGVVACEAEEKKRAKYATVAPSLCFVPV